MFVVLRSYKPAAKPPIRPTAIKNSSSIIYILELYI
jgi:hypothetical protein